MRLYFESSRTDRGHCTGRRGERVQRHTPRGPDWTISTRAHPPSALGAPGAWRAPRRGARATRAGALAAGGRGEPRNGRRRRVCGELAQPRSASEGAGASESWGAAESLDPRRARSVRPEGTPPVARCGGGVPPSRGVYLCRPASTPGGLPAQGRTPGQRSLFSQTIVCNAATTWATRRIE